MNRDYTIHEHNGIKFVNLSKKDIVTSNGDTYLKETEEYVITDERRADCGVIYTGATLLKTRSVMLFNSPPDNISAAHVYNDKMTFAELIHLPHPGGLEWVKSLPEDVLVIATPQVAQTYGYPVCMFRSKKFNDGKRYHIVEAIVWSKIQ